jgi:hypothetical protein
MNFPESLTGKETDLTGGITVIQFEIKPAPRDKAKEISKTTAAISATVCYKYKTKLSTGICIDTEPYRPGKEDAPCEMEAIELQNQGAPVAITRIEPTVRLSDDGKIIPSFKVFVENVGKGIVMNEPDTKKACDGTLLTGIPGITIEDWAPSFSAKFERVFNKVSVATGALKLGNSNVTCTPSSITLKPDTARNYFVCEAETFERGKGSFVTSLNLTLEYGYTETKSKIVTIEEELI